MRNRKVVLAKVGWMAKYEGVTEEDPKPEGQAKFLQENIGVEAWNFIQD